jgi:hypothetical protein
MEEGEGRLRGKVEEGREVTGRFPFPARSLSSGRCSGGTRRCTGGVISGAAK